MRRHFFKIFLCLFFLSSANAKMVVTYRSPESATDTRYNYDNGALRLALEKTKAEYGDYEFKASESMTFNRAIKDIENNDTPNFIFKLSYEERFKNLNLDFAKFPVDLGIVGFRVCFTNTKVKERLKSVKTLDDLRKFTHGQGNGWSDVGILRYHKFEVFAVGDYESLFSMVAVGRFDLFCRGTNEILSEYNTHKKIEGLTYDETFSIAYPLPRFFYTNKKNKDLIKRIQKGLIIAFNDGSLKELWRKEYLDSINFVKLKDRKIFYLKNPNLENLKFDYQKYFLNPLEYGNK